MINLHESMGPGKIELAAPRSAVRHVTNCATQPSIWTPYNGTYTRKNRDKMYLFGYYS